MRQQVRDTAKSHYWMAAVQVTYMRVEVEGEDPKLKSRTINVVFTNTKKQVSYSVLNQARKGVMLRFNNEFHISPEQMLDVVFLGFSYLGVMSEEEFNDMPPPPEGVPEGETVQ